MTGDRRSTGYDDATIEQLVRDVAAGWTMPPVRLDAPGWRERVRRSRARRLTAPGSRLARLGQAATAGVALSVIGALVAVVLTGPSQQPGKSAEPSSSGRPGPTPAATPLPKLFVPGDEPNPSVVVVRDESGDFARVDLAAGLISGPLTGKSSASQLRRAADGSLTCLCVEESGNIGGMPTDNIVSFERYDARGKLVSSDEVERFSGDPDPRDESLFIPERPAHVLTSIGLSEDGRYGFVGWSLRAHPVWRSGILVVDLSDGKVVSRLSLPDATDGEDTARRVVDAPRVVGVIATETILVARGWYQWTPPTSEKPAYTFENDVFRVRFGDGALAAPTPVPNASDCGATVNRAGALRQGGYWLACTTGSQQTVVRRLHADGSLVGDVRVPGSPGIDVDRVAVSPDEHSLVVWDPGTGVLSRIDLESGAITSGRGIAASEPGPLTALGNWLAPTASAKSSLRGALAFSPDGTRVYAIGVKASVDDRDVGGSTGVFVFDAKTLQPITVWQPTADYISIAVSADGNLVYAAGLPRVDAAGRLKIAQQASITVFDATDGTIRLIAGRLGGDALSFLSPTLR
jgi:hypothetical protein